VPHYFKLVVFAAIAACSGGERAVSAPARPAPTQVFRQPAGVANKPIAARPTGLTVADELIVTVRDGADPHMVALDAGGVVSWRAPRTGVVVVRFDDAAATERGYRALRLDPNVADVERNRVMGGGSEGSGVGTSPGLVANQWNIPALGLTFDGWGDAEGVVVAVLDSGAAFETYADDLGSYALAPDLAEVEFLAGYDFINDDAHPNDDHGHGTHVTGVIAASAGIGPMAPGVDVLPVKVLDADNLGTELALAEGIRYATDNGADVINMSLSFPPTYFPSRYLQSAVDYANQHGVVLVSAVGNHAEDVVTYPAAFRDVVAVTATSLSPWYRTWGTSQDRWAWAFWFLERAPYANRGQLVDFAAPAGRIDSDADDDGNPEAILAQTFANGDPTDFGYYYYAGTSQAAAQVSGIAAVMLAVNPDLTPYDLRSTIAETAVPLSWQLLSEDVGRGRVNAGAAIAVADHPAATRPRDRFYATVLLTLHELPSNKRYARAEVEVLDENGEPAPGVVVYGSFTGAAFESAARTTNGHGRTVFKSKKFGTDGRVVAFQVDAIGYYDGWLPMIDRPRGFIRIDSVSLELLAEFANGIAPAPALPGPSGTAAASGAGGDPGGSGVGTSPGDSLPGMFEEVPITIRYDIDGLHHAVPSLMLPNFSWSMATVPMAVVVEEDWFLEQFPDAEQRVVTSFGSGVGTSPLWFIGSMSFPTVIDLGYGSDPAPIDLVLATFTTGSGVGTSPGFRAIFSDALAIDATVIESALDVHWTYWWDQLAGSGVGTSPGLVAGISPAVFTQLGNTVEAYVEFGLGELSSPVGAYGAVLEAAGLDLAPVDPVIDGTGVGTSPHDPD
jgi:serine protease